MSIVAGLTQTGYLGMDVGIGIRKEGGVRSGPDDASVETPFELFHRFYLRIVLAYIIVSRWRHYGGIDQNARHPSACLAGG